ncbi:MAG TPA: type 1 glutamine amidotransferase domain-containing protein [Bryobacteraceae bacterium]|jgi:putative intracellular protease/amidase
MKRVLMPLPECDFDPTEAAVSWRILSQADIDVVFATPRGDPSEGDPLMLTGEGLDLWSRVSALKFAKLFGLILRANANARRDYSEMIRTDRYRHPLDYNGIDPAQFDGLLLPGGHCARGMRPYLENGTLQGLVAQFFDTGKPVAAICHGVLLAARSTSSKTGKSVLYGRKTTALTWKLEQSAWNLMRLAGRRWDPDYYRTYTEKASEPSGYRSVQSEVTRALAFPEDFEEPHRFVQSSGVFRDSDRNTAPAFVIRDGNYISARWPGDAHRFAREFATLILH